MSFQDLCKKLEAKIQASYEEGVTVLEAERLAGEFLSAQIQVSNELKRADLSARMRKSGLKAIRAAVYLNVVQTAEKRPTEAQTAAMVDSDEIVSTEQTSFDTAEVERDALERYYSIFQNAHIYYRGIAKGKFE